MRLRINLKRFYYLLDNWGIGMKFVKSRENNTLKHIHKLVKQKKYREKSGQFVAEGLRICQDILLSDTKIDIFLCSEKFYTKNIELSERLECKSAESIVIPDSIFSVLSDTKTPQGVLLVLKTLDKKDYLDKIESGGKFILLENVQNPENVSTVLRTAEAFAIDGVFISKDSCDVYSPKVVRGSMGAIFRVPFYLIDSPARFIKDTYNNYGRSFAACLTDEAKSVNDADFSGNCLVAIGNEANGLTPAAVKSCNEQIIIPMKGKIDSLNAGVAASIILWEMSDNE